MKCSNIKLPIINVKADPLDALLYGLGLRLAWLDKNNDERFAKLVANKNIAILFESDGIFRYYRFHDGHFGQAMGSPKEMDLTITFVDSMMGAKLLVQGDLSAIMTAVQEGRVKIVGDYKLVLWLSSLAKYATTIPQKYEPYIDKVRPYMKKMRQLFKK